MSRAALVCASGKRPHDCGSSCPTTRQFLPYDLSKDGCRPFKLWSTETCGATIPAPQTCTWSQLEDAMEMKVTVSQAVHANGILMKKILDAHCRRESAPGTAEQEAYELLVLHRQQEEGGGGAAALRGTESAVLALLA